MYVCVHTGIYVCPVRANLGLVKRTLVRDVLGKEELYHSVVLPEEISAKNMSVESYLKSKAPNSPVFLRKGQCSNPWLVDKYLNYCIQDVFASVRNEKELPTFIRSVIVLYNLLSAVPA